MQVFSRNSTTMKMASLLLSVASGCFDCSALHLCPRKKQINNYSPTFITTPSRKPNPLWYVGVVLCLVIQSCATRLGLTRQTPKAPCTITQKRLTCIAHPVRRLKRLTPSTYLPTHWLDLSFFNNIQWEVSCVWCSRLQQTPFHSLPAFVPLLLLLWKSPTRTNWLDTLCLRFGMNWYCKWCPSIRMRSIAHLLPAPAASPTATKRRSLRYGLITPCLTCLQQENLSLTWSLTRSIRCSRQFSSTKCVLFLLAFLADRNILQRFPAESGLSATHFLSSCWGLSALGGSGASLVWGSQQRLLYI